MMMIRMLIQSEHRFLCFSCYRQLYKLYCRSGNYGAIQDTFGLINYLSYFSSVIIWKVWKQWIESSLNNRDVSPPPTSLPVPPEMRKVNVPANLLSKPTTENYTFWGYFSHIRDVIFLKKTLKVAIDFDAVEVPRRNLKCACFVKKYQLFFAALGPRLYPAKFEVIQLKVGRRRFPTLLE